MTYSIIARCSRTGAFGGGVVTSSLAVGNRCLHVADGVGAFLSQHRTDPRLGEQGLALLAAGDPDFEADAHAFAAKFQLFEFGRWPVGVTGSSFNLF